MPAVPHKVGYVIIAILVIYIAYKSYQYWNWSRLSKTPGTA